MLSSLFFAYLYHFSFLAIARGRKLRDDLSIFEGDMILQRSFIERVTTWDNQNEEIYRHGSDTQVSTSALTKPLWQRWKDGVIPYDIHHELSKYSFHV